MCGWYNIEVYDVVWCFFIFFSSFLSVSHCFAFGIWQLSKKSVVWFFYDSSRLSYELILLSSVQLWVAIEIVDSGSSFEMQKLSFANLWQNRCLNRCNTKLDDLLTRRQRNREEEIQNEEMKSERRMITLCHHTFVCEIRLYYCHMFSYPPTLVRLLLATF